MWLRRIPSRDCMQAGDGIVFKSGHTLILLLFFLSILMPCRCCESKQARVVSSRPSRWYKKSGFLFDEREFLARLQWRGLRVLQRTRQWSLRLQKCIKQIHLPVYWKCISIKHCDTSNTTLYGEPCWPTLDALSRRWFRPFMFSRL
jgi:hypothetical protein